MTCSEEHDVQSTCKHIRYSSIVPVHHKAASIRAFQSVTVGLHSKAPTSKARPEGLHLSGQVLSVQNHVTPIHTDHGNVLVCILLGTKNGSNDTGQWAAQGLRLDSAEPSMLSRICPTKMGFVAEISVSLGRYTSQYAPATRRPHPAPSTGGRR